MRTSFAVLAVAALVVTGCGEKKKTARRSSEAGVMSVQGSPGSGGVIYVVDSSGEAVAGNIFDDLNDVYLDGSGLADGDHYYIITDNECSDEIAGPGAAGDRNTLNRIIHVEDGDFTELMQLFVATDFDIGANYQVKITPVEDYEEGEGCFGFLPEHSKTDTFTVRPVDEPSQPTYCVSGSKFFDRDGDGVRESPDVPVAGISIGLFAASVTTPLRTTQTSATGQWAFCGLPPGEPFDIREVLPLGWHQSFPPNDEGHHIELTDHDITGLLFGNYCLVGDQIPAGPELCIDPADELEYSLELTFSVPAHIDDDFWVYVNGVTVYADDNGIANDITDTVSFTAMNGDEIRIVALDTVGNCRYLPDVDILRPCDGVTQHLSSGFSSQQCGFPADEIFVDDAVTLDLPYPGLTCFAQP